MKKNNKGVIILITITVIMFVISALIITDDKYSSTTSETDEKRKSETEKTEKAKDEEERIRESERENEQDKEKNRERNKKIEKILEAIKKTVGKHPNGLVIGNKGYVNDCSGFVKGIYQTVGINILRGYSKITRGENLVGSIFRLMKKQNKLHFRKKPDIGDLVFFSYTYDRNQNGDILDDSNTHIWIVTEYKEDGTVIFAHNLNKEAGVRYDKMNLFSPSERKSNSALTTGDKPVLSGELWNAFAKVIP